MELAARKSGYNVLGFGVMKYTAPINPIPALTDRRDIEEVNNPLPYH